MVGAADQGGDGRFDVAARAGVLDSLHRLALDQRADDESPTLQRMLDVVERRLGYRYGAVLRIESERGVGTRATLVIDRESS